MHKNFFLQGFKRMKKIGPWCCGLLVLCLLMPGIDGLLKRNFETSLHGYVDPIPPKPTHYLRSFFDKSLQIWIEKTCTAGFGLRAYAIRTFHEIDFRLFREMDTSRLKLMTTKAHGLYSNLSIDSLNREVLHKDSLEIHYRQQAKQLLAVQQQLAQQGKYFIVVIASSKAYVYPQGLKKRLLVGGSQDIFERAADFGAILKQAGVHVVDSRPLLRTLVKQANIETHPTSGLHWNYYAACVVGKKIITNARQHFSHLPRLYCGPSQYRMPPMNDVDMDGYALLNVWSTVDVLKPTSYPTIHVQKNNVSDWRPKIVVIGDSFSDQIQFVFKKAHLYRQLITLSYMQRRIVDNGKNVFSEDKPLTTSKMIRDVANSDIVILEMVDYNLYRDTYGFAASFLTYAK